MIAMPERSGHLQKFQLKIEAVNTGEEVIADENVLYRELYHIGMDNVTNLHWELIGNSCPTFSTDLKRLHCTFAVRFVIKCVLDPGSKIKYCKWK